MQVSSTVVNPVFGASSKALTAAYSRLAGDVSSCLQQITMFVRSRLNTKNVYGIKTRQIATMENISITTNEGNVFSAKIAEIDKTAFYKANTNLFKPITKRMVIGQYDTYVEKIEDTDLKSIAKFYRVFLLTALGKNDDQIGYIGVNETLLSIYVVRQTEQKPVVVFVEINLSK